MARLTDFHRQQHPPAFRQLHPRTSVRTANQAGDAHTATLEAALCRHRTRHDARWGRDSSGRPSTVLYAILPYVAPELGGTIVNASPWPIKGGGGRLAAGGTTDSCAHSRFPPSPRYWHFASIKPQGPRDSSSPATLVAPSASTTVQHNTAPRAHPC
jgi:hypothetical protein